MLFSASAVSRGPCAVPLRRRHRRLLLRDRLRRLRRQRDRARSQTVNLVLRRDDEMKRVRPPNCRSDALGARAHWMLQNNTENVLPK